MKKLSLVLLVLLVPVYAFALDFSTVFSYAKSGDWAGLATVIILPWVLGMIIKKASENVGAVKKKVGDFGYKLGKAITDWFQKNKVMKSIWNNTVEPWLIIVVNDILIEFVHQLINGFKSDNPEQYAPK
jgi:hypothetical protein